MAKENAHSLEEWCECQLKSRVTEGEGCGGTSDMHTFLGYLMSHNALHIVWFNTALVTPTVVRSGPFLCRLG